MHCTPSRHETCARTHCQASLHLHSTSSDTASLVCVLHRSRISPARASMAVAHTTGRLRSAEWASQALARLARPAAAPCRHSARRLAARAAGASPADKGAASGAPAPAQRNSRTSRTIPLATTAHRELELGPANLMSQYREQKQVRRQRACKLAAPVQSTVNVTSRTDPQLPSLPQAAARGGGTPFVLPLLVLPLCELPTKTLTLPVPEEACYSRMFALVDSSASRLFGACLADPATQSMESGEFAGRGGSVDGCLA